MKVLFLWSPEKELREYIQAGVDEGVECIFPPSSTREDLLSLIQGVEVMVGWRPERELLEKAPQLRLFQNPGVGVQHLIPLFQEFPRIMLANSHGNTYFTAQHAVALLLALGNRVVDHHNFMVSGRWRTGDKEGASRPLRHKTVGLLGYGAIGSRVASFLSGWEVDLIACRRQISGEKPDLLQNWYGVSQLEQFLGASDILIVSLPQTTATEGLIGRNELDLLGREGLLINVGRGPVISEKELYLALKERRLAGAGIDVWYDYQPRADEEGRRYPYHYPFHELDNVVLSPHRAASPFSDLERWGDIVNNINRLARGQDPLNLVDRGLGY